MRFLNARERRFQVDRNAIPRSRSGGREVDAAPGFRGDRDVV
jgi:hypothetical protein